MGLIKPASPVPTEPPPPKEVYMILGSSEIGPEEVIEDLAGIKSSRVWLEVLHVTELTSRSPEYTYAADEGKTHLKSLMSYGEQMTHRIQEEKDFSEKSSSSSHQVLPQIMTAVLEYADTIKFAVNCSGKVTRVVTWTKKPDNPKLGSLVILEPELYPRLVKGYDAARVRQKSQNYWGMTIGATLPPDETRYQSAMIYYQNLIRSGKGV